MPQILVAQVQLRPNPEQASVLAATLREANAATDLLSNVAWEHRTFGRYALQRLAYHQVRERYGLSAQVVVRLIAKVADAYKLDRKPKRTFKPLGAIAYDARILRYFPDDRAVSIWTVAGRQTIPFIASDSDGGVYAGARLNGFRHRHRRLRGRLQAKGTKSAKRLLKKRQRKESRFARDVNHCISKSIVAEAERTERGIALEDLKGIRERIRARRPQRATLHSWAFAQLGTYLTYEGAAAGVPVVFVDPRNTSKECPECGHIDKANRPTQAQFRCTACGLAGPADTIAAMNIRVRGRVAVMRPDAGDPGWPASVRRVAETALPAGALANPRL